MQIKYWPSQQGIELNSQISNLFKKVYLKFNSNLCNTTCHLLSIDILNGYIKKELFKIILLELEILLLDIVEIDITIDDVKCLNKKILIDLFNKSLTNFNLLINNSTEFNSLSDMHVSFLSTRLFAEHHLLLQDLLMYLIFGFSDNNQASYLFNTAQVPHKHVEILLDNFVIQVADLIFYQIINNKQSLTCLFKFLKINNLCHSTYISIRSLATFKNNLLWNYFVLYYIQTPIVIYNNRYKVWIFTVKGLTCNYIYADRENDLKNLSSGHVLVILLLELQDFILPKMQNILFVLGKCLIYFIRYFIKGLFRNILSVTRIHS